MYIFSKGKTQLVSRIFSLIVWTIQASSYIEINVTRDLIWSCLFSSFFLSLAFSNVPWKRDRQCMLCASLTSDLDKMYWQTRRWVISIILVIHSSRHLPASSDNFPGCTHGDYTSNQQDCTDSLCLIADSLWSQSRAN